MEIFKTFTWRMKMGKPTCSIPGCGRPVRSRGACVAHFFGTLSSAEQKARVEEASAKFWSKVDKSGDCWEWNGARYESGYGAFRGPDGRVSGAHRYAFAEANGDIEPESCIDHLCGNRACVNPDHLRLTTNKQNIEHRVAINRNNKSGYRGVYFASGAWQVKVRHNYKSHYLYGFSTPEEANQAAIDLRNRLFTHNDRDRQTAHATA